ncbi:hypothetical protein D8674_012589 [Pyrus ussuriensis x Pyrus communis]|uniref:Uncharacterized protein n=1 Tax=Pyrus ussuriensis x Pyrus communis TaxID=2448454 RepID=A0A5N5G6R8_9ROSA|nr:hypothetical protein D8674_012589 [Pyrus ussuriensis x Pyrus communis]
MGKIRKLMDGVLVEWKRMKNWYRAYKIQKMPNSQRSVEVKRREVMENTAPTFNHDNPLYAEIGDDVKAAKLLKEASLWKGKAMSFHPDNKEEQNMVKKAIEREKKLKAVPAHTK